MTVAGCCVALAALLHPVQQDGEIDVAVQLDLHLDRLEAVYTIEANDATLRTELTRLGAADPGDDLAAVLSAYASAAAASLVDQLEIRVDDAPLAVSAAEAGVAAGHHSGVQVRLVAKYDAQIDDGRPHTLTFDDANFLPADEAGAPTWRGSYRLGLRPRDPAIELEDNELDALATRAPRLAAEEMEWETLLAAHQASAVFRIAGGSGDSLAPFVLPASLLGAACAAGIAVAYVTSRSRIAKS